MKILGNIINPLSLRGLCVCILLLASAGCVREDFGFCEENRREFTLKMEVATKSIETKADAADGTEIKTIDVYAFHGNNLAGYKRETISDQTNTSFYMDVTMYVLGKQKLDFYVIANADAMKNLQSGSTTLSMIDGNLSKQVLDNLTFTTITGLSDNTLSDGMPFIDKRTYYLELTDDHTANTAAGHEGHSLVNGVYDADGNRVVDAEGNDVHTVAFHLKRPIGKLRVFAAKAKDANETMVIKSVVLKETGTRMRNFVMPQGLTALQNLRPDLAPAISMDLSNEAKTGVMNYTGAVTGEENATAEKIQSDRMDEKNYTNILGRNYFPYENPFGSPKEEWDIPRYYNAAFVEDPNGTIMGNVLEIQYQFGTGEVKTGTVYLPPIERNTQYDVLCLMNSTGVITITYTVADWDMKQDWTLDYNYPDYTDIYPKEIDPQTNKYIYPENGPKVSVSNDFAAMFKFYGPEGGEWTPVIDIINQTDVTDANTVDYIVSVWRNNTLLYRSQRLETDTDDEYALLSKPLGPSNLEYEIRVQALKEENVGAKVKLGISFVPAWATGNEKMMLLINGGSTSEGTMWGEHSGSDPLWIEIEQID